MQASNHSSNYLRGISWFILSLVISVTNDVFAKYLGQNLHSVQITFLRFLFGTLSLLPFMIYYGKKSFYTSRIGLHLIRGVLLFCAIALWCFGLTQAPITVATTLTFIIPMFVLILARIFLSEKVSWARWLVTIVGFLGTTIVLEPTNVNFSPLMLLLVLATAMFATLDVINKKFVVKESMLAMLFYTALVTMLLGAIPTIFVWQTPSITQLTSLFLLGCGGNLILYCLLKAFAATEASAIAPFRYIELILSAGLGFAIFREIPTLALCLGSLIIIPCTLFLMYSETKSKADEALVSAGDDEPEPITQEN